MTGAVEGVVTIRHCESQADLKACVELQRRIWKYDDEDVVPAAIFVVAQHSGGHALCAFDGSQPIGFALAFAADHDDDRYWHSHMVGVLPEYQNRGVGRMLKLRQRDEALAHGVSRIDWTFDPLELRNAYFNIVGLGTIVRRCIPNCYGETTSPLHGGLPTDRFVAEWRLRDPRVDAAIQRQLQNPTGPDVIEVPISASIASAKKSDLPAARRIQTALRERVTELFREGYAVTGFRSGPESCHYLLESGRLDV